MRFKTKKFTYNLTAQAVDSVSEEVSFFLKGIKAQRKNIISARLTVEELLLKLMDKFGDETEFVFTESNFFGKPYITLSYSGEQFNPLESEVDDEFGSYSGAIIRSSYYTPSYSYVKGINTLTIRFSEKQFNPIFKLIIAIASALAVSMLRFVLPSDVILYIEDSVLKPLYNTFLGLMTTVEIPLVFLSVGCGIIGIGDSSVFGKIGRKMVLRFVGVIFMMSTFAGIVFSFVFTSFGKNAQARFSLKSGVEMLLKLIPQNLVEPIIDGNTMQVVLMAVFVGIAIVVLGDKTKVLSSIMNEGNTVIVYITSILSKLLPFFIFIILLNNIWDGNLHLFADMWKPICAFALMMMFLLSLYLIYVSLKEKVSIVILVKKTLPNFLISLGTSSSVAANGECSQSLNKRMGVKKRFVDFGQPVGGVIFMPSTAINFLVCALYMATYYKVDVSLLWFVVAIILCSFVAVATPPVPGGAIAAYTIIFSQLGLPVEAVTTVVALDIVFDFIATAFDGVFLQLELVRQADKHAMLNVEKLRADI
ncbi:MAG: cation:dicarboxylase symporter family transporter [Clostridia bacterium]|nr:cation:dicarboxylase symporter family transporter [Clostridia bacterium]